MKWEYEPRTLHTMYALEAMVQHWVENEVIIENAATRAVESIKRPDTSDEETVEQFICESQMARETHDQVLVPMHRYSCVVMLYATVERELLRLVENLENEHGPQKLKWKDVRANSKLEQISKFCEAFFSIRLSDCPQYNALKDLQKVRDCIIHCLGDVSLSADKDYLCKLPPKRLGLFAHPEHELVILEKCIQQFVTEVWNFFTWIFKTLNWPLKHFENYKLGEMLKRLPER